MKPADIIAAIQDALQNSADLSYVNDENILIGIRESITMFPVILIEPINDTMNDVEDFVYEQRVMRVNVTGYVRVHNKDKQIVGDANTKGVLDFENDIRKALSSDNTLGNPNEVIDTRLVASEHSFEQYPIRGFAINVEVTYKQIRTTRA